MQAGHREGVGILEMLSCGGVELVKFSRAREFHVHRRARVVVLAGLHQELKTNLLGACLLRRVGLGMWFLMTATAP